MAKRKPTEKQLKMIKAYKTNGGNKTQAYKTAYNCEKMKSATINRKAVEEFDKPHIKEVIRQHDGNLKKKFEYGIEQYIQELNEAREDARKDKQHSSVIRTIELKGRAFGLDKQIVEQTNTNIEVKDESIINKVVEKLKEL